MLNPQNWRGIIAVLCVTDCLYGSGPVKLSIELFSGLSLSPGVSLSTLFHKTLKGRTMVSYHDNVLQKGIQIHIHLRGRAWLRAVLDFKTSGKNASH